MFGSVRRWMFCGLCFLSGMALPGLWQYFPRLSHFSHLGQQGNCALHKNVTPGARARLRHEEPKPWGKIEVAKLPLTNPDELFLDRELRMRPPEWFFENYSEP